MDNNNNNNNNNNENKEDEKSDSVDTNMDNNDNNNNNNNTENMESKENNNNGADSRDVTPDNTNSNSKFMKPTTHSPKILPIGQRVKVTSSLYTQYEYIGEKDEKEWVRKRESNFNDNYNISTVTIIINPNCELIKKYPANWSKKLMHGFNLYMNNDFCDYDGRNKNERLDLKLAFIEPLCYFHIYFNAPQQLTAKLAGRLWAHQSEAF